MRARAGSPELPGGARPGVPSAASGHAQWLRRRPRLAQLEARGGEAGGADARAAAEGTGGRRRGGDAGGGAVVAVRPQGARGAAAAAPPLGSVSGAGVRGGRAAGAGSHAPPAVGRAEPAPPRRHGPPPRASAGTRRGNPRASSRPSLRDPPVLRRPLPPPYSPPPALAAATASAFRYGNGATIPPSARGARSPRYADLTGERGGLREHPETGGRHAPLPQRLRAPLASGGRAHVREGQSG